MQRRLWEMIMIVAIPLIVVIIVLAVLGIAYALRYNAILNNVTTASNFNQDFKDNVDLKMYYYVIDSQYSEGLPIEEVYSAKAIAQKLIDTTTKKDSLRAISSVLNLCHNLEEKMQQIAETEEYDSRVDQLEKTFTSLQILFRGISIHKYITKRYI